MEDTNNKNINTEVLKFSNIKGAEDQVNKVKSDAYRRLGVGTYIPYGDKNTLPTDLLELIYTSTTHQSIIEFKKSAVIGGGLAISRNEIKIKDLVRDISWEEFIERTVYDLIVFGGFSWQIVWNKRGDKINGIYHQPFHQVRSGGIDLEEDSVLSYFVKRDWSLGGSGVEIKTFNPNKAKEDGRQLYYYKEYNPINEFYPVPVYYSAYNYIKVENELGKFYHNIVTNGMFPSLLVNVEGNMPDTLKEEFVRSLNNGYKGGVNANKVITMFNEGGDAPKTTITPIEAVSNDNLFSELNEIVTNRIINAHRIPRTLVGVEKNLGLSSNGEELRMSFEYFNNTVILPIQNKLIAAFKTVAKINFKSIDMTFQPLDLITQALGESTLMQILTVDELRERIGYEPIKKEATTVNDKINEVTGDVNTVDSNSSPEGEIDGENNNVNN
jgi:hypothetical protein